MNTPTTKLKLSLGAFLLGVRLAAFAQTPVITSFSQNGQLICTNLPAGGAASVEWASSLAGPWQTNWTGLEAVTANSNGVIQVSVPMFYRVRVTAVTSTNHAPVAVDDTDTTTEDTTLIRAASSYRANDTDSDGDSLTITAVFAPSNGTVTLAGANITFTPAADFSGTAGYDYTVSDGALTDIGHVALIVTPVNDPPILADDFDSTSLNTSLIRATSVYLTNDIDVDSTLSITAVSNPVNGVVALVGTTITFTPATDFTGTAGFDYTVSDGTVSETGHVTVFVN